MANKEICNWAHLSAQGAIRPGEFQSFTGFSSTKRIYILLGYPCLQLGETEVRAQGDFLNNTGTAQPWFKYSFSKLQAAPVAIIG